MTHCATPGTTTVLLCGNDSITLLDKLLPKLQREGHKVLIFSQMVRMIEIIEEYADALGYPCEKLTGQVKGNERQKSIDRFNKDKDSFLFLLSNGYSDLSRCRKCWRRMPTAGPSENPTAPWKRLVFSTWISQRVS